MTNALATGSPYELVLPHDAVWAIYEPSAVQIWRSLAGMDMSAHVRDHVASDAEHYFAQYAAQHSSECASQYSSRNAGGNAADDKPYQMDGSLAVITLSGPMTKGGTSLSRGGSTVYAGRLIGLAAADADVKGILLRIDSPGGSVSGTQALADRVRAAAAKKPVHAVVEDMCASAAYWVAATCTSIAANPTALIGSIGTYMAVADYSRQDANAGVKVHVLSTGKHKGAGVPGSEITGEQLAAWQAMVDGLNSHFLAAVQAGRKIDPDALADIADGRVFLAKDAQALGLIDTIGSYEDAAQTLTETIKTMSFLEKVRSLVTGEPQSDAVQSAEAVAQAADAEIARLKAASDANIAAKEAEIAALKANQDAQNARVEAEAAEARKAANAAAIASLVASHKLTPAVSAAAENVRALYPEAFDAIFAAVVPDPARAGTAGQPPAGTGDATRVAAQLSTHDPEAASAELSRLMAEKIKANPKMDAALAFKAVISENPEIAKAAAANR